MSAEATVLANIAKLLNDASTAVFSTAELRTDLDSALDEWSEMYSPRVVLATATCSAGTTIVDISGITDDYYYIDAVEYKIDKATKRFRNWTELDNGNIDLDVSFTPVSGDTVRLYLAGPHIISGTGTNTLTYGEEKLVTKLAAVCAAERKPLQYWRALKAETDLTAMGTAIDAVRTQIARAGSAVDSGTAYIDAAADFGAPASDWLSNASGNLNNAMAYVNEAKAWIDSLTAKTREITVSDKWGAWAAMKRKELEPQLRKLKKRKTSRDWPKVL